MMKEEEHMHEPFSLQYCIQNTVQPNDRSPDFEHTTENDSRHENAEQTESDSPNYNSSRQFSVSLDSENPVQVVSSIYQDSRMTMLTTRQNESNTPASDCHLGVGNDTASGATENTERPRHPMYEQCSSRVASYATWRQFELFDIAALAQAGFYNIGERTVVRCFFCAIELSSLSHFDDPILEHIRKSPSCGYLRTKLGPDGIAGFQERIRNGTQQSQGVNGATANASVVTSRNPGQWSSSDRIRSPQYQAYSVRLASFARWPNDIRQRPEHVADAGFYYTGLQDVVRCFACHGGLKNWYPEDDPWIEHSRWFPQCPFVWRVKGQEFIDLVRRMTEESDEERISNGTQQSQGINGATANASVVTSRNPGQWSSSDCIRSPQYQAYSVRIASFARWPEDIGQRPEHVADAGFYYTDVEEGESGGYSQIDLEETLRENRILRYAALCERCEIEPKCAVFVPCYHRLFCSECATSFRKCPICRKPIENILSASLS